MALPAGPDTALDTYINSVGALAEMVRKTIRELEVVQEELHTFRETIGSLQWDGRLTTPASTVCLVSTAAPTSVSYNNFKRKLGNQLLSNI